MISEQCDNSGGAGGGRGTHHNAFTRRFTFWSAPVPRGGVIVAAGNIVNRQSQYTARAHCTHQIRFAAIRIFIPVVYDYYTGGLRLR